MSLNTRTPTARWHRSAPACGPKSTSAPGDLYGESEDPAKTTYSRMDLIERPCSSCGTGANMRYERTHVSYETAVVRTERRTGSSSARGAWRAAAGGAGSEPACCRRPSRRASPSQGNLHARGSNPGRTHQLLSLSHVSTRAQLVSASSMRKAKALCWSSSGSGNKCNEAH